MTKQLSLMFSLLACTLLPSVALSQTQPSGCGDAVTVQRGDTLSSIAERCDVTERSLMRLNPRIQGSRDLRVGMHLDVSGNVGEGLGRLGSLAGQAVDTLSDFARNLGSSAQDLLDRNPDLRQRMESVERQLQSSGTGSIKGSVSVTPAEIATGETLTVTAQGLPSDTPVVIGAGRRQSAYEIIERARTSSDGTLRMNVRVPDWTTDMRQLVVIVAAENSEWSVRSDPITVTGSRL
jgi:LysM repeat protein